MSYRKGRPSAPFDDPEPAFFEGTNLGPAEGVRRAAPPRNSWLSARHLL